jgi:hypothetical protein
MTPRPLVALWTYSNLDAAAPQDKGPDEVSGPINVNTWNLPRLAAAANRAAPTAGVVHDLPDGGGAAAALRRATQATIHFAGGPRPGLDIQGSPHVGVTEYIAGTNNHGSPGISEVCWTAIDTDLAQRRQRKNSELIRIPILRPHPLNFSLTLSRPHFRPLRAAAP